MEAFVESAAVAEGRGFWEMAPASGCRFYCQVDENRCYWFCCNGLLSDIIVEVDGVLFHLHKFPLLSKCGKIAHLVEESQNTKEDICHKLMDFPGGPDAFLLAAKFCYGIRVDLTPKNILMVYCAAEYLKMTEEYEEENLFAKAEDFLHKVILRSWKNCIWSLKSFEQSVSKAENYHIVVKCLNALSVMVCTDPSLFGWPMKMYGSLQSPGGSILWNGINTGARIRSSLSDWWFDDISCLSMPLFNRLIGIMNVRGIRPENIAGALMYYARKYIPGLDRWQVAQGDKTRSLASMTGLPSVVDKKHLLEGIAVLLPEKKGKSYCRFLLGLLRIAIILNTSQACRDSLERRIGLQLELATLDGLLIPTFSDSENLYDTDCVKRIILHFLYSQGSSVNSISPSSSDPASPTSNSLKGVTKLVDSYLAEIASDINLKPEKMQSLLSVLPESLRSLNDGLYRAVDIYFEEHPWLSENERDKLCSNIGFGKLSIDACAHASQNERLPLRVVLQVLFFEQLQLRAALSHCIRVLDSDDNVTAPVVSMAGRVPRRDGWVSLVRENHFLRVDLEHMTSRVRALEQEFVSIQQEIGRVGRSNGLISSLSTKLGCIPVPQMSVKHPDVIESCTPSPRRSVKEHDIHRRSIRR